MFHADRRTDIRIDIQTGRHIYTYRQKDRETDMTKLIVAFRNFVYAPKKSSNVHVFLSRVL